VPTASTSKPRCTRRPPPPASKATTAAEDRISEYVGGRHHPSEETLNDLAGAQRQLTVLQWVISGLTGTALVLNALMGEQQRPQQVTSGLLQGLRGRLPVLALAGTGLWVRRSRRTPTS
jgi:hypothetical protein